MERMEFLKWSCCAASQRKTNQLSLHSSIQKRKNWWNEWRKFCFPAEGWLLELKSWVIGRRPISAKEFHSISFKEIPFHLCWLIYLCPGEERPAPMSFSFLINYWKSWLNWNVVGVELGKSTIINYRGFQNWKFWWSGQSTIPLHSIQPNPTKEK